jgi:hypothetical protein
MFRTLSELRDSINQLIEQQGEDAGCAAFVFTQDDVFEIVGENCDEVRFSKELTEDVLCDVGGSSYIYEQIGEMVDDAICLRKGMEIYQDSVK